MIKRILFSTLLLWATVQAEPSITWSPCIQQPIMYFSSDRVTMGGMGIGVGTRFERGKHLIGQTDANIFWANGNAVSTRLALGYQRDGRWKPALLGTFNLLWGQRIEVLSPTGQRPVTPVWVIGLRCMPLHFKSLRGFASALEIGYGISPDHGMLLEISILTAGFYW